MLDNGLTNSNFLHSILVMLETKYNYDVNSLLVTYIDISVLLQAKFDPVQLFFFKKICICRICANGSESNIHTDNCHSLYVLGWKS